MRNGWCRAYGRGIRREKWVLVHIGPHLSHRDIRYKSMEEISNIYRGEVVFAEELMKLEL